MSKKGLWASFKESCGVFDRVSAEDIIKANDLVAMSRRLYDDGYYVPRYEFTNEGASAITPEMMNLVLSQLSSQDLNTAAYNSTGRRGGLYNPDPAPRAFMMLNTLIEAERYDLIPQFVDRSIDFNCGDARFHPVTDVIRSGMPVDEKLAWVTIMSASGLNRVENKNEFAAAAHLHKLPQMKEILTRAGVYMGDRPDCAAKPAAPPPSL